jgi:hypothetical protein
VDGRGTAREATPFFEWLCPTVAEQGFDNGFE